MLVTRGSERLRRSGLPGIDPDVAVPSLKTWESVVAPSFVLEVASDDYTKDYEDNPVLFDELGVKAMFACTRRRLRLRCAQAPSTEALAETLLPPISTWPTRRGGAASPVDGAPSPSPDVAPAE